MITGFRTRIFREQREPHHVRCGKFLFIVFCLLLSTESLAETTKTLRLTCLVQSNTQAGRFLIDLYNRALEPLGYNVEFINAEPAKMLNLLKTQEVDGSCARDKAFITLTGLTHLRALEHSSATTTFYAITHKDSQLSNSRSALTLGYIPALKRPAQAFLSMRFKEHKPYTSPAAIIQALRSGKIDLGALPDAFYAEYKNRFDTSDLSIHEVIYTQPAYVYLTERYADLVKPFSRRLATLAAQGESYHVSMNKFSPIKNAETLVFGCATKANGETHQRFTLMATKAFHSIGYNLKVVPLSRARERLELEQGRIDGSCAKSRHYVDNVSTSTLLIEAPLARDDIDIFTHDAKRKVRSVGDFKDTDRIAIVKGTYVVLPELKSVKNQLLEVNSVGQGLTMLASDELDFFIDFKFSVIEHLDKIALNNSIYTAGHLSSPTFYPVLHRKHESLLPALTAELKKLISASGQQNMLDH